MRLLDLNTWEVSCWLSRSFIAELGYMQINNSFRANKAF